MMMPAIARNDQRDALFQRPHAAIVPDVVPDVFYRAPGTLVGSARADVEQNGRCDRHYDEYELHGSSPIGQLALNVRSEAVPTARAPFHCGPLRSESDCSFGKRNIILRDAAF